MDDQLDQLLVTREIQDEIKSKIQDKIDELSKNLFNTMTETIENNFDDIFRQQSENMSNYYEFVDWRYFSVIDYEWQRYTLKYRRIVYSVMSGFTLTECPKIGALFIYKSNRVVWNRLHLPVNGI